MLYRVVAIRDRAADLFSVPSFVVSTGAAVRSFSDSVNAPDSAIHAHPEDYDLYELGTFDDNTGTFTTDQPRQIAVGKDQVR